MYIAAKYLKMNCLLIASTAIEIAPFIDHYNTSSKKDHIEFKLDILITGVGILNTAYQLTTYLNRKKPDLIIMVGIAGTFNPKLALGKVVAVKNDIVADLGVMEKKTWIDGFDLKLIDRNKAPYSKGKLLNTNKVLLERTRLPLVNAVTVNQITTSKATIEIYKNRYKPAIESMEGAALHFIALNENIPFIQIRGVSNYIGERNKKNWKIKEAVHNSNLVIIHLFESL